MTLRQQAEAALAALISRGPGPHTLRAKDGATALECELTALDTLACAFTRLTVRTDALADASMEKLKRTAESLSKRLTYLLEPIAPIESDAEQCLVQLRSAPPEREDGKSTYYELIIRRGGEVSLCRYLKSADATREIIPAQVTREVLLRLIGDLSVV